MAASMGKSGSEEGMNEINITPFVDVMLVLLILFMISTPVMVYEGMKINLPRAASAQDLSHVTLKITIARGGEMKLDSKNITMNELKSSIARLKKEGVFTDAVVIADAEVTHGRVMEVADYLRSLGVTQVGFAAQRAQAE